MEPTKRIFLIILSLLWTTGAMMTTAATAATSATSTTSATSGFNHVGTAQMSALLNQDGVVFVDSREPDAFNGWVLNEEQRGGHIPKATNLAASWVTRKLERTADATRAKHLEKADMIVVYGENTTQAQIVADWLVSQGLTSDKIGIYADGYAAWAKTDLPVVRLPHYEHIVPASWLHQKIESKTAMVIEASWGKGEQYQKAHIPGAVHLNTDMLESDARNWNFLPPAELEKNLLAHGITADSPVVVYGEAGIDAARAAVAMLYMGVKDVRFLNGGLEAWISAGYPTESGMVKPSPAQTFGVSVPQRPGLVINTPEAKQVLQNPDAVLVSIRAWAEYIGETSGYSYIKPKGRIKGAVWGHGGTNSNNMDDFRNPDNTMRDYTEIARFWADWGITPDKDVVFFCGTGWRASESLLYAMAMGFEHARLFDDGWYIWSMDPANPTATGQPQ